jgi:hypothetical protein
VKRVVCPVLLLAAALLAAACGRFASMGATLAYQNAGTLLTWTVDDYVGLTHDQKAAVHEKIAHEMLWHRDHELPAYRRLLASAAQRSQRPYTAAEVSQAWDEVRADYRRVVERVLPEAARFLATLDEAQAAHLERRFFEDEQKFEHEMAKGKPEERRARAAKRMIRALEDWTGRLSPAQRALIVEAEAAVPPMLEERFGERRYRQQQVVSLVRTRDAQRIERGLRRLLLEEKSWRRSEYQALLDQRDRATLDTITKLSATLSAEQRAHLVERIQAYIADIDQTGAPA